MSPLKRISHLINMTWLFRDRSTRQENRGFWSWNWTARLCFLLTSTKKGWSRSGQALGVRIWVIEKKKAESICRHVKHAHPGLHLSHSNGAFERSKSCSVVLLVLLNQALRFISDVQLWQNRRKFELQPILPMKQHTSWLVWEIEECALQSRSINAMAIGGCTKSYQKFASKRLELPGQHPCVFSKPIQSARLQRIVQ